MRMKFFTIPIKNLEDAEAETNLFLGGHRVLAVTRRFLFPRRALDIERKFVQDGARHAAPALSGGKIVR
jgi:hypothetical protein